MPIWFMWKEYFSVSVSFKLIAPDKPISYGTSRYYSSKVADLKNVNDIFFNMGFVVI